jgi:hypothetical protein
MHKSLMPVQLQPDLAERIIEVIKRGRQGRIERPQGSSEVTDLPARHALYRRRWLQNDLSFPREVEQFGHLDHS